ncbi:MAG TPA: adenine phosphoribosyltransferase, partial [Gemmatimonadales bacterium]|nr:adenine phosphoribosyltransferase [Gemmatimonadales bacterium]
MPSHVAEQVRQALRAVPDYPKPGIIFQDITPVLHRPQLFRDVVRALAEPFRAAGVTHVVGIEARGFIFGAPVALELGAGFIPLRKPGKLPWESVAEKYALEYGEDSLHAHRDACAPGDRVLVVDDVLATGGTADAAARLVRVLGAELAGWSFLLEIGVLQGRRKLAGPRAEALLCV